jgi:hypothetical protein
VFVIIRYIKVVVAVVVIVIVIVIVIIAITNIVLLFLNTPYHVSRGLCKVR